MSNHSIQPDSMRVCTVCETPNPASNLKCRNCGLPLSAGTSGSEPRPESAPSRPLADMSGGTVSLFVQGSPQPVIIHPDEVIVLGLREHPLDTSVAVDFSATGGQHLGVAHHHAVLQLLGDFVHIEDLGSPAGTYVNNQELVTGEPFRLRNGDQIHLGDLLIVFMYYGDSRSARLI